MFEGRRDSCSNSKTGHKMEMGKARSRGSEGASSKMRQLQWYKRTRKVQPTIRAGNRGLVRDCAMANVQRQARRS